MKKTSSQTLKQWHRCESETTQLIDKSGAGTLSEKVEVATTWLAGGPVGWLAGWFVDEFHKGEAMHI